MSANALKLVKTYCYFAIAAAIYGILWSHLPIILGSGWITCIGCPNRLVCLLKFHSVIAPTVLFNLYIAWYGLKRFSEYTVAAFRSLLTFAGAFNFVFFAFEVDVWNESWQR